MPTCPTNAWSARSTFHRIVHRTFHPTLRKGPLASLESRGARAVVCRSAGGRLERRIAAWILLLALSIGLPETPSLLGICALDSDFMNGTAWALPKATPKPETQSAAWTLSAADFQTLIADGFSDEYRPIVEMVKRSEFDKSLAAIEEITKTAKRPRYIERLYFLQGVAFLGKGELKPAEAALNRALSLRQEMPDALYFLGFIKSSQQKTAEAYHLLSEAQWFLQPTAHCSVPVEAVNFHLSVLAAQAGDSKRAEDSLQAALTANPQYVPAIAARADRDALKGNRPDTIKHFRDAIAKSPGDPDLKIRFAKALLTGADRSLNQDDLSEAERNLREVLGTASLPKTTKSSAQLALAKTLVEEGKLDDAQAILEAGLKASPGDAEISSLLEQLAVERSAAQSKTPVPDSPQ